MLTALSWNVVACYVETGEPYTIAFGRVRYILSFARVFPGLLPTNRSTLKGMSGSPLESWRTRRGFHGLRWLLTRLRSTLIVGRRSLTGTFSQTAREWIGVDTPCWRAVVGRLSNCRMGSRVWWFMATCLNGRSRPRWQSFTRR